jgi:hypothetical protein
MPESEWLAAAKGRCETARAESGPDRTSQQWSRHEGREQSHHLRSKPSEQAWSQQNASEHFAHYARLRDASEQPSHHAAHGQDDGQLQNQLEEIRPQRQRQNPAL